MTDFPRTIRAMPRSRWPDFPSWIWRKSLKNFQRSASREEHDLHLVGFQRGVRRDDPVARVARGVADDGEGRLVDLSVHRDFEPRELVAEKLPRDRDEDPAPAEPALQRRDHVPHDPGVEPHARPEEKRPLVGDEHPERARDAVEEEVRRLAEVQRNRQLPHQDIGGPARQDRQGRVGPGHAAGGLGDRPVAAADRDHVEPLGEVRPHDLRRVPGARGRSVDDVAGRGPSASPRARASGRAGRAVRRWGCRRGVPSHRSTRLPWRVLVRNARFRTQES